MLNPNEIWLAEYSPQQGCFNIETAREGMENNLRQILEGWTNSYLPFAFCGSHEEASRACDELAEAMLRHGAKMGASGITIRMQHASEKPRPHKRFNRSKRLPQK